MNESQNSWIKVRHNVIRFLLQPVFLLISILFYHLKLDKFSEPVKRPFLILANHQTDFDQFFVAEAFDRPVYFVAMEDIFSLGFVSKLLSWAVAPIPFNKASSDIQAVRTCIRVARQGGTICIFPEGNRTYSGKTCYIKPSIAALAKTLKLPIAFFRIEGGYGIKPRWADNRRKGSMKAGVRRILEPEDFKSLSKEELYEIIQKELYVDETKLTGSYSSKKNAEYLERVLYVCPTCGLSEFESCRNEFHCKKCGTSYEYYPDLSIHSHQKHFRFKYVRNWYEYQEKFIRNLDLSPYFSTPAYQEKADFSEVIVYKKKVPVYRNADIRLFGNRIELSSGSEQKTLPFDEIKSMACIADHKLNIFHLDKVYQVKGNKHFNALKYCNFYYHSKYIKENTTDGEFQFLGL